MSFEHQFPDYAAVEALVARARRQRAAELGRLFALGATALARGVASAVALLRTGYDRQRVASATGAHAPLREWARRY